MTENEMKFVLHLGCEEKISEISETKLLIQQGYLIAGKGISLRCRKSASKKQSHYYLTFKSATNGRVIEIEKRMDERDFNDLWVQCLNKIEKTRYIVYDKNRNKWEIDFFRDYNCKTYFAMAEFEMEEGRKYPEHVPSFIKENLLYEVALTDCRFSSKFLADVRYAINLYKELLNGKSQAS